MKPEVKAMFDRLNDPHVWARCIVTYARPKRYQAMVEWASDGKRDTDDSGASYQAYYNECRSQYKHGAGVWVGD